MKKYIMSIGIVLLAIAIYFALSFEMFPEEKELLNKFTMNGETYEVYYLGGNATTQEVIQIKKKDKGEEYLIKAFEGYNDLEELRIVNDSVVQFILIDDSYKTNKPDTLVLKMQETVK